MSAPPDKSAGTDAMFTALYENLRERAHFALLHCADRTIDTTGLVHETYLKLSRDPRYAGVSRTHMLRLAAKAMRQIVIDRARRRSAQKRRPEFVLTTFGEGPAETFDEVAVLALERALGELETADARLAEVVELRFFGGLSAQDTAQALDVTERTVVRDWRKARAFLFAALDRTPG